MSTPVRYLWPHLHKALAALPCETHEELLRTGVCIEVDLIDSPKFICGVVVETQKVQISTGCLQTLWACGYLNMMYWDKLYKAGGLARSVVMDPSGDFELQNAYKLFEWSLNVFDGNIPGLKWPANLPMPLPDAGGNSWEALADELTLEAVGYLLLHEIAHVYLKHDVSESSAWSIEQEKEADSQALEWIFRGAQNPTNGHQIKRSISIATALLMQCAFALFTKKWGGESHPPKWQRLDQAMRQIATDPNHPVFAFLGQLARMYRTMAKSPSDSYQYNNFLAAFDHFIETLSKEDQA